MKYFLVAGEASGDLHGANLMKSLKECDADADFAFFGGDLMASQGGVMLKHYREMAIMGIIEVLLNLRKIKRNLDACHAEILKYRPDVLILIDYPGFNLKLAKFAHSRGIRVFWFIAPKVWATKEWRVKKLKAYVDEMFTIFPFETAFFAKHNMPVHYVGNPLVETIRDAEKTFRPREKFVADNHLDNRPIVALLPGSRVQEVKFMLPVMKRFAADFPDFQFVVGGSEALEPSFYDEILSPDAGQNQGKPLPVLYGQTYETVFRAHAALVTSGTATLETAMLGAPQAVLYKMMGGWLGYKVVSTFFLKVKYVSLPNLILNRKAVKEFIMHEMKYERIKPELEKLLYDDDYRQKMKDSYLQLNRLLGEPGAASRAAKIMVSLMAKKMKEQS